MTEENRNNGKNIVICCDGTGNEFGVNNTNVVKIYQMAEKDEANKQVAFYDPGVGTGGWAYFKTLGDKAWGRGLQKNVCDAYQYLMRCYEEGDRVYLFGFSRGAFTARSLAGMLHKCGLLYPNAFNMVEYASKIYNTPYNDKVAAEFKRTAARQCPVHFIGVWDTVKSLGLFADRKFHDAKLNDEVKYGYHAVSLDEVRKKFPPSLWEERNDVEQVWFAGVHSDVGGWYRDTGLSDIALNWMAKKARGRGMLLNMAAVAKTEGDALAMQHDSCSGMWRLPVIGGEYIRQLPPDALVHESVRQRIGKKVAVGNDKSERKKELGEYQPRANIAGGGKWSEDNGSVKWVGDDD